MCGHTGPMKGGENDNKWEYFVQNGGYSEASLLVGLVDIIGYCCAGVTALPAGERCKSQHRIGFGDGLSCNDNS